MKYREDVGSTYLGTDFQPDKDMLLHDNIDDLYDKVRDAKRKFHRISVAKLRLIIQPKIRTIFFRQKFYGSTEIKD